MLVGMGLVLLLLLGTVGFAQENTEPARVTENRIGFHTIDIFLSESGAATVKEQFFFSFFAGEAEQFEKDFQENTPSLAEWKKDYPFIHPTIGNEAQAEGLEFVLNKTTQDQPTLAITYRYSSGLVQQVNVDGQGRIVKWKIADNAFVQYVNAGSILIDEKTQIVIHFPTNSVVDKSILPPSVVSDNESITLVNFQGNNLPIQYTTLSPIVGPVDWTKALRDFMQSPLFFVLAILLIAAGIYLFANREDVSRRIETFVIENSEFRPAQKQDIDADLEP